MVHLMLGVINQVIRDVFLMSSPFKKIRRITKISAWRRCKILPPSAVTLLEKTLSEPRAVNIFLVCPCT